MRTTPGIAVDPELREALLRIAELEATLAGRTPPVRISARSIASLLAFALSLLLIAAVSPYFAVPRPNVIVQAPPPPPPPGVRPGVLTWRTGPPFHDRGPLLLDLDGDGTKDLVGLAWRDGQDNLPLHAVAFDRKTYAVRWRAGPFPAAWRSDTPDLWANARGIFVKDGDGVVHVLSPTTGLERESIPAFRDERRPTPDDGCDEDGTAPCTPQTDPRVLLQMQAFFSGHVFPTDHAADGDRFTLVRLLAPRGGFVERAVVWDATAKRPRWDAPLVPASQSAKRVNVSPNTWTALAHGRILHVYQPRDGLYRIAGRDVKTGRLSFDSPIPGLEDGSQIGAFTAESEDAFIVANESLFVIDSRTGQVAQRLRRF